MRLRNTNPLGQVDFPLIGRQGEPFGTQGVGCLEPGEEFDIDEGTAAALLDQIGNFEPADDEAKALAARLAGDEPAADQGSDQAPADQGEHPDNQNGGQ